jgi:hypothetical protein
MASFLNVEPRSICQVNAALAMNETKLGAQTFAPRRSKKSF